MLFCTLSPSARQRSITCREVTPSSGASSLILGPFLVDMGFVGTAGPEARGLGPEQLGGVVPGCAPSGGGLQWDWFSLLALPV